MVENKIENDFGSCEYSFEDDYVHIYNLFIDPCYRNKGHAKSLLNSAIAEIRKIGYLGEIQIVAQPIEPNIDIDRLKNFYKSMGLKVFSFYG